MRLYTLLDEDDLAQLRRPAAPVAKNEYGKQLEETTADMLTCMHDNEGIGLAAPQIGLSKRIIVIQMPDESPLILVNPSFEEIAAQPLYQSMEEGCLSVPGFGAQVQRFAHIHLKACNAEGEEFELNAEGMLAICIQHEIDHLDGILFIDHLSQRQQRRLWQEVEKKRSKHLNS